MTFLHPILAAAGIAAVSIPIIIHLLMRRRRRPVMWAAMRFLLEAYREHRRRLRLEQFLLLAARCLVIALIALGLARPMLGGGSVLGGRAPLELYLLVDNSLTSAARGEDGREALERHKQEAARLLDQLDSAAGDRAGLIALGGPSEAVVAPASADTAAVGALVAGLRVTDSAADISGGLSVLRGLAEREPGSGASRTVAVILSDFLTGSADTERRLAEVGAGPAGGLTVLATHPAERGHDNTSIVGVEPLRPILIAAPRADSIAAERTPVTVRLRRSGPGVAAPRLTTVRLRLSGLDDLNGPPTGQAVVRWGAGESEARASIELAAPSSAAGTLVLTAWIDDDAIAGDNVWRRTLEVRPSLRVGLIAPRRLSGAGERPAVRDFDAADWIRVALDPWHGERAGAGSSRPARDIDVVEIEPASVDAARLSGLDAVVLARPDLLADAGWRHLRHLADTGGLVVVFPPRQPTVHLWSDPLVREFGLGWTVGREPRAFPDAEPAGIQPAERGDSDQRALLAMIAYELGELAAPVQVRQALPVEMPPAGSSWRLLDLSDGTPLVVASIPGARDRDAAPAGEATGGSSRGLVVLLGVAPSIEWTNLQALPIMVPLLHELVVQGVARSRGDWSATAGTCPETPSRTSELRAVGDGVPLRVDASGRTEEPVRRAGLWRAVDDRGAARGIVAVHADAAAGRTDAQPASAIRSWLSDSVGAPQWLSEPVESGGGPTLRERLDRGNDSAPWAAALLGVALAFAVLELCLARWFSHAAVGTPGAAR